MLLKDIRIFQLPSYSKLDKKKLSDCTIYTLIASPCRQPHSELVYR